MEITSEQLARIMEIAAQMQVTVDQLAEVSQAKAALVRKVQGS